MARSSFRANRKKTGGRYKDIRKKKSRELSGEPAMMKIGEVRKREKRKRGGNAKEMMLASNIANVYDPKSKKYLKAKIETVVENPANRHFVRRNIITKGAIIKTDKGNAVVKSRPGQNGTISAVLIESK